MLSIPKGRTELEGKAFKFAAPSPLNDLQKQLKLSELIPLEEKKAEDLEAASSGCKCFDYLTVLAWVLVVCLFQLSISNGVHLPGAQRLFRTASSNAISLSWFPPQQLSLFS